MWKKTTKKQKQKKNIKGPIQLILCNPNPHKPQLIWKDINLITVAKLVHPLQTVCRQMLLAQQLQWRFQAQKKKDVNNVFFKSLWLSLGSWGFGLCEMSCTVPFYNFVSLFPHLLLVFGRTLSCCEAPETFCRLWNVSWLLIGMGVSPLWLYYHFCMQCF